VGVVNAVAIDAAAPSTTSASRKSNAIIIVPSFWRQASNRKCGFVYKSSLHNPAINACNYISRRYYYSRQHRRNYFRRMRRLLPIIIVGGATVASF
jgi:hypothetical protein